MLHRPGFRFALVALLFTVLPITVLLVHGPLIRADQEFLRGDADGTQALDISDAIVVLNYLFLGGGGLSCLDAADVNDDGQLNISDPSYLLNFLFIGGPGPLPPYPLEGVDPSVDDLSCEPCGESWIPCHLLEDLVLDASVTYRNGSPSVRLDANGLPHVIFPVAVQGRYAVPGPDGKWTTEIMVDLDAGKEMHVFWADIAFDFETGQPLAVVDQGRSTEVWERVGPGDWVLRVALPDIRIGNRKSVEADPSGALHAAVSVDDGRRPAIASSRDDWQVRELDAQVFPIEPTLSIAEWGDPHVAYWDAGDDGWRIRMGSATSESVTIAPYGGHSLEESTDLNFVVVGDEAPGVAHFLVSRLRSDMVAELPFPDGANVLDYLRGVPGEEPETFLVAEGDPFFLDPMFCFEAPPYDGAKCEVDFTRFVSLGMFASGEGDVYFLYSRVREFGRVTARCENEDPQSCTIESEINYGGDLWIGWVDRDGVLRRNLIASDIAATRGTAARGADGSLHVVVYDAYPIGDHSVRYLRFGP